MPHLLRKRASLLLFLCCLYCCAHLCGAVAGTARAGRLPEPGPVQTAPISSAKPSRHPKVATTRAAVLRVLEGLWRGASRAGMTEGEGPVDQAAAVRKRVEELQQLWEAVDRRDMAVVGQRFHQAMLREARRTPEEVAAIRRIEARVDEAILTQQGPMDIAAYLE